MSIDIDSIIPEHAIYILKTLASEDKKIENRIGKIITKLIESVDPEEIAKEIFGELNLIDVEDLWHNSGATSHGYNDPHDMAYDMVEGVITRFLKRVKEYRFLLMEEEAKLYCMGIVRGLYLFDTESNTQFREWAVDIAENLSDNLIFEWNKEFQDSNIKKFIEENCPQWGQNLF